MSLEPYQQRVLKEQEDLYVKVQALNEFVAYSDKFEELPLVEQELLKQQNEVMWEYWEILGKRIDLFTQK
jgi:hypothetical protein